DKNNTVRKINRELNALGITASTLFFGPTGNAGESIKITHLGSGITFASITPFNSFNIASVIGDNTGSITASVHNDSVIFESIYHGLIFGVTTDGLSPNKLAFVKGLTGVSTTEISVAENSAVDAQPVQEESQTDTAEAITPTEGGTE
ncbi:MAG: hypothetical protein VX676_01150, partial [Pseudomonadota bacterium]|nr:hypothetical protein [Pseudomonadota bacterium]